MFNAPKDVPAHPAQACRATLRARDGLRTLSAHWRAEGRPLLRARFGLHCGPVLVGNIGTPHRFAYTALGDAVNLASRLETLNKAYGMEILASEELREAAGPGFEWRRLDRVAVAGRRQATLVDALLGAGGLAAPSVLAARDAYERALDAYFAQRFAEAEAGFRAAARVHSPNVAAEVLAQRSAALAQAPPPGWDGCTSNRPNSLSAMDRKPQSQRRCAVCGSALHVPTCVLAPTRRPLR